jgi:hypothetical protein
LPDADPLALVAGAMRRRLLLVTAESAAIGAAVAAWWVPAGLAAAIAASAVRIRSSRRAAVVRALDRADPRARNLLTTADEIERGLLATGPELRERVFRDAAAVSRDIRPARVFPLRPLLLLSAAAALTWTLASALTLDRARSTIVTGVRSPVSAVASSSPTPLHVTLTIEPPSYTGRSPATVVDATAIEAVEGSRLHAVIRAQSDRVSIETDAESRSIPRAANGAFDFTTVLRRSGYFTVAVGSGQRRTTAIAVVPDALPSVRLTAPARDLVYSGGNPRIAFAAAASDDFGLRTLALRYTKVSGSGEQFEFQEGEIPVAVVRRGERDWTATATRTLADLGLVEGDMLVYRATAGDMRPGGGESSSDAYFIEVSKLGVAAGDAFTLPEQETRYALSQQMLIVKTERLHQRRAALADASFTEEAQGLAVEQRMIRSEFVFMLGGEVEDEEVEAEQSVELQAGRLANRGQRDLRAATVAMSTAEKFLTGANTLEALRAERAAVEALQRAFARDRYILRALATRSPLDPARRLTGAVSQSIGWSRTLPELPENRRIARLQGLLQGIGEARDPAAGSAQVAVLAELAVRIDPESAALRAIAADLQRLADTWASLNTAARAAALDAVAAPAGVEARRVLADAPARIGAVR